jgi:acetyl-CoA C-acetyltransferase
MEHLTHIPNGPPLEERGFIDINHRLFTQEEYKHWDILTTIRMGLTAEKLFSQTKFTREDMDRWAVRSHELAAKALKDGFFKGEILPIEAEQSDGTTMIVDRDQSIREDATYEALVALKPAFKTDGAVTAGSSSALTVGAGCTLLMSKETAKKKKIQPLATIRSIGVAGVDPTIMGVGPVPSTLKALQKAKLNVKDIDYWEINEAFCIVTLNCIKELGIDADKVNVMGGGIAIGHPLGATGIRLVGTLARILQLKGGRYGCATACVGGGQGVTTIIEKEPS